ncbi:alpha/beta fold hydrolase [Desulfotomaculum copahuensis]|uniref:AB hydrolase-1 domain-containing protein n=1 Tax=Desulfotomaculum copahuensis TaxID=1838280 RepID=A0A1B7LH05_9FIRM|nr:alpha/beta fold hydrolase [Desulfotomaculum copahuensis]OAT85289.1 hypothetical protein A6M21_07045 [Desulfotomaculum copahuensis]
MGIVVFIHGMGNDTRRDYWREWAAPLQKELAGQGLPLDEASFNGIYYYDLVPGPGEQYYYSAPHTAWRTQLRLYVQSVLNEEKDLVRESRLSLNSLTDLIVDNFGDIYTYLHVEQIHQAVNWRVYEFLHNAGQPVHLLGYSLGSIVAYCALQKSPPLAGRVAHFITLGSPLFWFRQGVERRADLQARPAVSYWTNLAGVVDIAWPQALPRVVRGLDENRQFLIERINPVRGHKAYFSNPESLQIIAGLLKNRWQ